MKLIKHLTDFPSPYELEIDSKEELEIIQLVPRKYAKKLPKEVLQRRRAIDGFGE